MLNRSDDCWDSEEFFDSAECLPVEESDPCNVEEDSSEYCIWLCEPQSVEQRRKLFLFRMGIGELGSTVLPSSDDCVEVDGDCTCVPGIERETEMRRALSSASECPEDDVSCLRSEDGSCRNSFVSDGDLRSPSQLDSTMERDSIADSAMNRDRRNKETSLWKSVLRKITNKRSVVKSAREAHKTPSLTRIKAHHNKKRLIDLSALYSGQDIEAHDGIIWMMKFSPNGQYLATGGEDGTVCIWRVMSVDASLEGKNGGSDIYSKGKSMGHKASVVKPDKIFWIDESPVQVLRGHSGDILDLAWSSSNRLLSSSTDNTVRLWKVGVHLCQDVFHHSNYVTCIQFNPVNEDYFISGSIDGKVRVWSVSTQRVVDWADIRDAISATCYRPHGKGFAVGTITGACHFYETTDSQIQRDPTISIQARRKRNSSKKITSIQFSEDGSERVLISSQDSKLRIFEGNNMVYKYRGPKKVGDRMSTSFSSIKGHVVSVGEDSRIYLWNQRDMNTKSVSSCEYFFSEGASVVVPWSWSGNPAVEANPIPNHRRKELHERFSLGKWFSHEGQCRTWPEEQLEKCSPPSGTWGLVFVTGSLDGRIRTFHNYGIPVRF
ncbi:hypothetical protein MLD38_021497 [Melastoma candidum]|uniref:Uncharacterized protein n=1 Tax=Melastoma candidum TaxID=119954 RepID=A0ACB9QFP5_9MYRT|nr:hypothetical protein MLD38_021497 [Melastoma candidum]